MAAHGRDEALNREDMPETSARYCHPKQWSEIFEHDPGSADVVLSRTRRFKAKLMAPVSICLSEGRLDVITSGISYRMLKL